MSRQISNGWRLPYLSYVARVGLWCLVVGLAAIFHPAFAALGIQALDTPAIAVKAPNRVFLIAIANAGNRLVAAGEHGVISFSDDNGVTWKQSKVPVDVTLTAVAFADAADGWAAGHYGVILHTTDGGLSWQEQLNGLQVNQLTQSAATAAVAANDPSPGTAHALKRAAFFNAAGADKPFLSILVTNKDNLTAFGAYKIIMQTTDGGKDWADWSLHLGDAVSQNIYDAAFIGTDIYLVGEQGIVFRSTDGGASYPAATQPSQATTLLVALPTGDGGVYVCGVAGASSRSGDGGKSWQPVVLGTQANLTSGVVLKSGAIVVGSESGEIYLSYDKARTFSHLLSLSSAIYGLAQAPNGDLVTIGDAGVVVIPAANFNPKKGGN